MILSRHNKISHVEGVAYHLKKEKTLDQENQKVAEPTTYLMCKSAMH
jgi:hypothetical protein